MEGNIRGMAFVIGTLLTASPCFAWTLAYHHDSNGHAISGGIDTLRNAVLNGQKVRMVINNNFAAEAQNLWVKDNYIAAQNTTHISVRTGSDGEILFQDNSYHWYFVVDTNGNRDMIRWNVGEHVPRGHNQDTVNVKWFVE